jgi:hypothetical protein
LQIKLFHAGNLELNRFPIILKIKGIDRKTSNSIP